MAPKRFDRIIVHVGQHKTGTTHIQNTLAANAEYLLSRGLYYPKPRQSLTGHHGLVRQFYDPSDKILKERNFFGEQGDDELILSSIEEQTGAQVAVLSSEALLTHFGSNIDRMRALDERLSKLAKSVRYLAYVRDPLSGFPGSCSQALMRSAILPRSSWAFQSSVDPLIKLRGLVGDRLDVRIYERNAFPGGDIVDDFLSRGVGVDIRAAELARAERDSNVSLSAEGMYLVQSIAIFRQISRPMNFPHHDDKMKAIAGFVRRTDSKQSDHAAAELLPTAAAIVASDAAEAVEQLRKVFGLEVPPSAMASTVTAADHIASRMLVRSVFKVDADRTISLAERLLSHPRSPDGLADLLNGIPIVDFH